MLNTVYNETLNVGRLLKLLFRIEHIYFYRNCWFTHWHGHK